MVLNSISPVSCSRLRTQRQSYWYQRLSRALLTTVLRRLDLINLLTQRHSFFFTFKTCSQIVIAPVSVSSCFLPQLSLERLPSNGSKSEQAVTNVSLTAEFGTSNRAERRGGTEAAANGHSHGINKTLKGHSEWLMIIILRKWCHMIRPMCLMSSVRCTPSELTGRLLI